MGAVDLFCFNPLGVPCPHHARPRRVLPFRRVNVCPLGSHRTFLMELLERGRGGLTEHSIRESNATAEPGAKEALEPGCLTDVSVVKPIWTETRGSA
ncbi:hypothetical protein AAFF_G00047560 [Aldrovandia affinis]|uniref:Uncharacterized protein n=1 Tax=Aldrovandia affinis TaxID=143900 RepID=A0AAD7WFS5_9TELE|nr:hypothetical protein AAFF_G00047560 [Aldrovandia affinis]